MTPEEALLQRVEFDTNGGCWLWNLSLTREGYGQAWSPELGRNTCAHRVSWELFCGAIPNGLVIDHLCRTRSCVNPAHLQPVTQQVNILRGHGIASHNAAKTQCRAGHILAGENLFTSRRGARVCRECARIAEQRRQPRHRPSKKATIR